MKTTSPTTTRKKRSIVAKARRVQPCIAASEPAALPIKQATIDDLRALGEDDRRTIVDFIISGIPMPTLLKEIESGHGLHFNDETPIVTFYQEEARRRWQNTFDTAKADADAMINILRHSDMDFSEALLKALGQEAFRMITQRKLDTRQVEKFTRLLLQARAQDVTRARARDALALQREKMERQFQSQLEKALKALADEIKPHPEVREYFALFRTKLREAMERSADAAASRRTAEREQAPALRDANAAVTPEEEVSHEPEETESQI